MVLGHKRYCGCSLLSDCSFHFDFPQYLHKFLHCSNMLCLAAAVSIFVARDDSKKWGSQEDRCARIGLIVFSSLVDGIKHHLGSRLDHALSLLTILIAILVSLRVYWNFQNVEDLIFADEAIYLA